MQPQLALPLGTGTMTRAARAPSKRNALPTSREAAPSERRLNRLERAVMVELARGGPGTPGEIAARIGEEPGSVRPRCSVLRKAELLAPTGDRRLNTSGKKAAVLRLACPTVAPSDTSSHSTFPAESERG